MIALDSPLAGRHPATGKAWRGTYRDYLTSLIDAGWIVTNCGAYDLIDSPPIGSATLYYVITDEAARAHLHDLYAERLAELVLIP